MQAGYTGRVAIVTGAGSGIGEATARRLHQQGASVVLFGRREQKLRAVADDLGERSLVVRGDVSLADDTRKLVEQAVAAFGRLDLLVNNAGTATFGPFARISAEEWARVMATNVGGIVNATQAALPHLLASRGSVVNVSSVSGIGGDWGGSVYNASKGAVNNLTRALALEFGGRGVRVNAVAPSLTETEMTAGFTDPALLAAFAARSPIGRAARPEEVASVIAFLGSADAVFVNGVILPVDGGLSASNGQPNMGFAG
jgi:meso-butanediol dehydrogenase/(S,S)-butanediol dehydrogenase/diacetyl reductase